MKMDKARKALLEKVKGVNDLIALKLMDPLIKEDVCVRIEPILLIGRDKRYIKAWLQNVLRVWVLTYQPQGADINHMILTVRDKEGNVLYRYSEKKGVFV